jgi:plastocyanin
MRSIDRREALKRCSLGLAAAVIPAWRIEVLSGQGKVLEIKIQSYYPRSQWFFDPVGLFIEKGQTVRWFSGKPGPTVTAFHPSNQNHELRIPDGAKPFDSGTLGNDSKKYNFFEWTFDTEGTYDYFSRHHEPVGLVGRIVVGKPGGPAEEHAPGYGARDGRAPVFPAQAKILAAVPSADIVSKKSIPYMKDVVYRKLPYGE